MASSSSEAAPPVAAGEDPFHLDTLMRAEEFLEPLPPPDEEFLARVREQRGQKGFVEIELTDDDDDDEEEGGNAAPPASGRGSVEEDRSSPEVTKKPGGGTAIKKLS
ncbi:hypothetical protein CFC21_063627 [Triticum aestivum]|uniref:Uncharacterized protein n=2 Tax=Triticum aestivum TaxID=4565 RepID=A0A9R1H0R0_WHEAT|nr:hypothetical protein CFC21_063627 [Triticum aestivum]